MLIVATIVTDDCWLWCFNILCKILVTLNYPVYFCNVTDHTRQTFVVWQTHLANVRLIKEKKAFFINAFLPLIFLQMLQFILFQNVLSRHCDCIDHNSVQKPLKIWNGKYKNASSFWQQKEEVQKIENLPALTLPRHVLHHC